MQRLVAGLAGALLATTTGCGLAETARDAAGGAADSARDALSGLTADAAARQVGDAVERVLSEAGYTVDQPPRCDASLKPVGIRLEGRVECTGEVSSGQVYDALFVGSLSAAGRCPGALRVQVDGDPAVSQRRVDVCRLARLFNALG